MSPRQRVFRLVALVAYVVAISATMLLAGHTRAQPSCNPQWQPFDPSTATISGADGQVWAATEWDPDGAGPEGLKIVIGGEFAIAGSVLANKVAAFDPATGEWSAFGSGIGGSTSNLENRVIALCAMPDGRLVAAGKFYSAGSQSAASIAVWNGDEWSALGSGINNTVTCVAAMPNGDIIAGGYFTAAGGIPALNIARWDGSAWHALAAGVDGEVRCLLNLPNGDLVVGGYFQNAGGVAAQCIARWSNGGWQAYPSSGTTMVNVYALTHLPGSMFAVSAVYIPPGGSSSVSGVVRWNQTGWVPMGPTMSAAPQAMRTIAAEQIIAGGLFTSIGGVSTPRVASWNGSAWIGMGAGIGDLQDFAIAPGGQIFAVGRTAYFNGISYKHVARWSGSAWQPLSPGLSNGAGAAIITSVASCADDGVVLAGTFDRVAGISASNIARWDGSAWTAMNGGANGTVNDLARASDGGVVASGVFTSIGGVSAARFARWDGAAWNSMTTSLNPVNALAVSPAGQVSAGGFFPSVGSHQVARWTGVGWSFVGSGVNGTVNAMIETPQGLVIAGAFSSAGGVAANRIALWDGSGWTPFGLGMTGEVHVLAVLPDGRLFAGGSFSAAGGNFIRNVALWDGSGWFPMGSELNASIVRAAVVLPGGELVVGCERGSSGIARVYQWNGAAWISMASFDHTVRALTVLPNGDLVAAGQFVTVDGRVAPHIARFRTPVGCTPACDPIDFNADTLFPDTTDITDFLTVFSGGVCSDQLPTDPPCNTDIDFNNDGLFPDTDDITVFLRVFSGGQCG